jgi:hypothetical protein
MTAQPYELFRVALDYEALQDAFLDRIEDLDTTFEQIELAVGMPRGHASRLLCKSQKRVVKALGPKSLSQMLKGTGLALALVVDDERFAAVKEQLAKRKKPRQPANAGSQRPAWLFTREKAREMGKKRFATMTDSQRIRHQRKAGKASGRARRIKAQLITSGSQPATAAPGRRRAHQESLPAAPNTA